MEKFVETALISLLGMQIVTFIMMIGIYMYCIISALKGGKK